MILEGFVYIMIKRSKKDPDDVKETEKMEKKKEWLDNQIDEVRK